LRRHYSFSALKEIDWNDLCARYYDGAESAETIEAFVAVIREMLAELKDIHVWIELPDGRRVHSYSSGYRANYNHQAVAAQLEQLERFGRLGFTGRTKEGFGVAAIIGLPPEDDDLYEQLIDAMTRISDAPGFIVDLRSNGGGAEPRARQIAGLFADKRYSYARHKVRSGPDLDDFSESPARHFEPATSEPFTRPVVCLVGPGCVSSGEGFALMMKAMDQVTLVGQPTRGASGNPRAVTLPNGVKVWFSRWVSMEPDGTPIEGQGIQPDVKVEHTGSGDPTFDKAVEILRKKTS
jgi:C-terminal processing protease CtpA/Prc